ncbi:MAG: cytochrome c oxidase subunit 3 [Thermaerobacter sp.]|nr:cytochrome c oxidase subunit 3 [Thermaerobacter sp.]
MTTRTNSLQEARLPLEFQESHETLSILGFWLFLASDVVLFSSLFAVYAVYQGRVAAGPTPLQLFSLGPVLTETILLLTSSFTCGLAIFMMRRGRTRPLVAWLVVTLLLGLGFVGMEVHEFVTDVAVWGTWHQSAFLSAFFTLVGTHGLHVSFGILWVAALVVQLLRYGLTPTTARKVYTFSLYWHFLDIIWVFIFTAVYLSGKIT